MVDASTLAFLTRAVLEEKRKAEEEEKERKRREQVEAARSELTSLLRVPEEHRTAEQERRPTAASRVRHCGRQDEKEEEEEEEAPQVLFFSLLSLGADATLWARVPLSLFLVRCAVFPSFVDRFEMLGIMAGMYQKDSPVTVRFRLQKTVESPQLQSIQVVDISFAGAEAVSHGPDFRQTIDILLLLYKVVDVPVSIVQVHFPVVAQRLFPMAVRVGWLMSLLCGPTVLECRRGGDS